MRRRWSVSALLWLLLLTSAEGLFAESPKVRGTLCIAGPEVPRAINRAGECVEVIGLEVLLEPALEARRFGWLSDDGRRLVVGMVAPDADHLLLDGALFALELSGSREREWPQATTVKLSSRGGTIWEWSLEHPERLRSVVAPAGLYDLKISAPRHFAHDQQGVAISDDRPVSLGRLTLDAHPAVTVRLVTPENQPVSSATMLDPEGETLAFSDAAGSIRWESDDDLPERVIIVSPELAPRSLDLPRRRGDLDLGTLVLSRGGTLRVTVDRGALGYEPLQIRLVEYTHLRDRDELYVGREVRRERLSPDMTSIELERLEPRRFALYVSGDEPLRQFAEFVTVEEERVTDHSVDVRPYILEVEVFDGDQRLPAAEVAIGTSTAPGPEWKRVIRADERGYFSDTMWQRGDLWAGLQGELYWTEGFKVGESDERHRLRLRVSNRAVEGRLIDAESRAPIASGRVTYHWRTENGQGMRYSFTDDSGRFSFDRLKMGEHTIVATVPDYEEQSVTVDLPGEDDRKTIELELRKAPQVYLRVTDTMGRPVQSVAVLWPTGAADGSITTRQMSDTAGLYSIPVEPKRIARLLIAPPNGSFAWVEVEHSRHSSPDRAAQVVVPPVAGPLSISARDSAGNPRPGVDVVFRYDGIAFPPRVLRALASVHGVRFSTGAGGTVFLPNLPPGQYTVSGFGGGVPFYPEGRDGPGELLLAGPSELTLVAAPRE